MLKHFLNEIAKKSELNNKIDSCIEKLKNKNVIVYGDTDTLAFLDKKYGIVKNIDIVAFVYSGEKTGILSKYGIKKINNEQISEVNANAIFIIDENSYRLYNSMKNFENFNVINLFEEEFQDENLNREFLIKYKFNKTLKKLILKLKGKKVLFYGGGLFFNVVNKYYDLSPLNAIGVVDKRVSQTPDIRDICGYMVYKPDDIIGLNPDYIVISTKRNFDIAEELYYNYLKETNIKITPLVKKNLWATYKEG